MTTPPTTTPRERATCTSCGLTLSAGPYAGTVQRCDDCALTTPEPCDVCTTRPALRRYPASSGDQATPALAASTCPEEGIGPYLAVCGRCDRMGGAR